MANKYEEIVDKNGKLYVFGDMMQKLENDSEVYKTVEHLYGMVWFLAAGRGVSKKESQELVERAQAQYKLGLAASPGTHGFLPGSRA